VTLAPGARLGPYEVVGPLGAGGMGEVYKARDTRLGRTVAVKVLLGGAASDPDRRRRFEQEARAVSALNHPHICVLHDIGSVVPSEKAESGKAEGGAGTSPRPVPFLVMEYLDGQTLADRLGKGPLPLAEGLDIAIQVADALAAAHRAGIVHRDLKPANVMLVRAAAGAAASAKLLDFGLARLAAQPGTSLEGATETAHTAAGLVAGTAPYMAPEQIEGRPVDARTDLFAFGAVLFEIVTGARAFEGSSPASVMAAILEREPRAASDVRPNVPPAVDRMIRRCLAKDPDARWQTASDLAETLRWLRETGGGGPSATTTSPSPRRRGRLRAIAVTAAAVLAAAALTWYALKPASSRTVGGMSLDLHPAQIGPFGYSFTPGGSRTAFAWSADGQTLVFSGIRGEGERLYARKISEAEAKPIEGTDGALQPVVSPDGRWVAFWTYSDPSSGQPAKIKKIPFGGGPVVDLASNVAKPKGMAWDEAGNLFFGQPSDGRIWIVQSDSTTRAVTTLADGELAHVLPSLLPGGQILLFTVRKTRWSWGGEEVVAQTLATGTRKTLLKDAADARYLSSGHLVFLRRSQLMAVAFDPDRLEARGDPVVVLDSVAQGLTGMSSGEVSGAGQFAVSASGALAWIRSPAVEYPDNALVTVDRRGAVARIPAPLKPYGASVRLSPDGRRLAVSTRTSSPGSVWVYDLERTTLTDVMTGTESTWVHWRPRDGRDLLVDGNASGRGTLQLVPSDRSGPPRALMPSDLLWASSFTPDGRQLILVRDTGNDIDEIVVTKVEDGQARLEPLIDKAERPDNPEVSPDGRWLAYTSRRSGSVQVYVRPFPGPGAPVPVSVDGGTDPAWNRNGAELFFVGPRTKEGTFWMMAAAFSQGMPPRIGSPKRLFEFETEELPFHCVPVRCYDVAPDGQSFYIVQGKPMAYPVPVAHLNYAPNWVEELKAKLR
jgi:eukaryotic-like serine/threonine-protein kinase